MFPLPKADSSTYVTAQSSFERIEPVTKTWINENGTLVITWNLDNSCFKSSPTCSAGEISTVGFVVLKCSSIISSLGTST
jgi:hypothetical protein